MNTLHTPNLTIPEHELPMLALPVFSDLSCNPGYVAKLSSGAEQLANITLAFGTEAVVLQGKNPEAVKNALVAGKLAVELALFENKPAAAPDHPSTPGIFAVDSHNIPDSKASWHTLLTLDGDALEISTRNHSGTRASGTFQKNAKGTYAPQHFSYAEQLRDSPYAGTGQSLTLHGVLAYKRLLREEGIHPHQTIKDRFRGLVLLGSTASQTIECFAAKTVVTTAYVSVESETFQTKPWWIPAIPAKV
jgi:hypothetical protein